MRTHPRSRLTHTNTWNITIIIYQAPLMRREIKPQHVVVDFVGVLVEAAKGVDLAVPAVRDGGIDEARRSGPHGTSNLRPVAI